MALLRPTCTTLRRSWACRSGSSPCWRWAWASSSPSCTGSPSSRRCTGSPTRPSRSRGWASRSRISSISGVPSAPRCSPESLRLSAWPPSTASGSTTCSPASIAGSYSASRWPWDGWIAISWTACSMCSRPGPSWRATVSGASRPASRRTMSTALPSESLPSSSGCSGRADAGPRPLHHHVGALHRRRAHHVPRAPPAPPRPLAGPALHRHLVRALTGHLLGLRSLTGRRAVLPVLRGAAPGTAARHQLSGRRGWHEPAPGAPDQHHHLRGRLRLLDDQGAQPGVLRAPARAGDGVYGVFVSLDLFVLFLFYEI